MAWFKVDDKLHDHRKARKAGRSAMGVWVLAGSWSMDNLTDGFIPSDVLARWGTRADADKLVKAGFWFDDEHDGEPGWRFHDWERFQPSAAVTAAVRAKEAEAGARGNHKRWHADRGITDPNCEYCYRVPDREPDREPDWVTRNEGESGAISGSDRTKPEPVPHVLPTEVQTSFVRSPLPDGADRFDEFWETYGKKVDRKGARQKWLLALRKPGVTADMLIAAAAAYVLWERTNNENGRYIMGPAKWLLNERWTDERPARPAPQSRVQQHLQLARDLQAEEQGQMIPFPQIGGDR